MGKLNIGLRKGAIGLAMLGGIVTAVAAAGQVAGGFGPGPFGADGPPWATGAMPARPFAGDDATFAQYQQERLANLKATLAITAEQQPAWDAFTATAHQQAQALRATRATMVGATAQEWVATRGQMMSQRQKAWTTMEEARTALGAALTPEQRVTLDQVPGPLRGPR